MYYREVNLDGGGSWIDGKVMNSPSDARERSIAGAQILLQKKQNADP